jgi:hypothetical protein
MSVNPLRCHPGRFDPRVRGYRRSTGSSALLITLTFLALVTILVIAFLGLASQDLKSTYFYVRSDQADQIARGGLDFVVGNLQGEAEDSALSTTNFGTAQSLFYVPTSGTNAFPKSMITNSATTNILLCSSNTVFYNGGLAPSTMASTIASTNSSLNNQVITVSDWNKPMLVPFANTASMPIPNWVFVGRNGPVSVSSSTVSSTVSPNLTNPNAVIGRYAFVVYDTSGLLDINVAGYDPSSNMTNYAAGKGLLPYADLTQLPGITAGDASALVQFRNAVSETNYPLALTNSNGFGLESNGFMQVYSPGANGPSDSTFLSRQELIQYATNNPDWTNALPFLTTFSRELNGPTWGPTTNATGASYQYQSIATNAATATATTTYNPNIYAVRVPASWVGNSTNPTRNNGLPWVAGDPLVKYRFPLDKLALLAMPQATLTAQQITEIQEYFGLDVAGDITSDPLYRHWNYPTQNSTYVHTSGTILSLAQVAALSKPREPDFFELLQAGILNGSLGGWGRGDGGQSPTDYDTKTTVHIMRIGANIINQWDSDDYPVTITYATDNSGTSINVYGVTDLPYITQMFTKAYSPNGDLTVPVLPYIYFQVWNPHQAPTVYNPANYPSKLRVVPFTFLGNSTKLVQYSDTFTLFIAATPPLYSSGAFKWTYNPTMGYASNAGGTNIAVGTNFFGLATTYGGGYETNSAAGLTYSSFNFQTNYREPGLLVGTPNPVLNYNSTNPPTAWSPGSSFGGGSPSGPLAAISLPAIPYFPPNGQYPGAIPSRYNGSTNSVPDIQWTNSIPTTNGWRFGLASQTVFAQQFMDTSSVWHTYGTFEGVDAQTASSLANFSGWNTSGWWVPGVSTSPNDVSWAKTDPRTERFGPGNIAQQATVSLHTDTISPLNNASTTPLLNPNSTLANIAWPIDGNGPFTNSGSAATPFRMDYWAVNNPNNAIQGPFDAGTQTPYMADLDGITRGADSAYGYSSSRAWGINPLLPGGSSSGSSSQMQALPARPVMLNHPFNSVGDLGYAYRDDPFRTLDFMTPGSADAGLLDLFNMSEAPVVAGRINPNTPYTQIVAALVSGATQSSLSSTSGVVPTATVPVSTAQNLASTFVTLTSATPITNRASLVTSGTVSNIINDGYFTDNGNTSLVKTEGESLVRSLAESSNTRTWNFLIDVIGQSGHFLNNSAPVTSGGKDNFVVDGERHYWLHVAIDRYTGKVVAEQLELVDQ